MRWVAVAIGGSLGAVLRYGIQGWVQGLGGTRFPWGTLAVNVIGSFLLGVLMALTLARAGGDLWGRTFWGIGLLGAFTTYSTFSYETLAMLQIGDWRGGLANILLHLTLGLGAALAGLRLAGG